MAAPTPALRKELSAPGMLNTIRQCFERIPDNRRKAEISLADALMSGLAVFGLKYPSLLKFDEAYADEETIRHNLNTLYGVERAPSDTQLREILDPIDPEQLRPAFQAVHRQLQRGKALEAYEYWDGHYIVSVDGTGQYASSAVSCKQCCVKHQGKENESYYHQLLGAVIVHPGQKTVLPLMPEAITHRDGATKNDCERNAAKRLLRGLREDFPTRKLIIVEDGLASNAPHIRLLNELDMRFILGAKPGDHVKLFDTVLDRMSRGECGEHTDINKHGVEYGYRWTNSIELNQSASDLKVNFLEYWEIKNGKERIWSWVTDLALEGNRSRGKNSCCVNFLNYV